jgi:AcrR family transcriptional regulator
MTSQIDRQPDTDESVKMRLVRAADEEMRIQGTASVTMAAVADRAGVSRATAFRQLGGTSKMIIQVGLYRARHHIERAREIVDAQPDIFMKLEDLKVYTTQALPEDPVILALMAQRSAAILDEDIRAVNDELSGPILLAGQAAGIVRNDISVREIIDFLVEQTYLAADYPDRSEQAARHRFRTFIAPALRPQPVAAAMQRSNLPGAELDSALSQAADAIASARAAASRLRLADDPSHHGI